MFRRLGILGSGFRRFCIGPLGFGRCVGEGEMCRFDSLDSTKGTTTNHGELSLHSFLGNYDTILRLVSYLTSVVTNEEPWTKTIARKTHSGCHSFW